MPIHQPEWHTIHLVPLQPFSANVCVQDDENKMMNSAAFGFHSKLVYLYFYLCTHKNNLVMLEKVFLIDHLLLKKEK
jgi:hypothetical protein